MDKFLCWDCGDDVQLIDSKIIDHVKNTGLKTVTGEYLLICKKCEEEPDPY